jgi:hypothetical protein
MSDVELARSWYGDLVAGIEGRSSNPPTAAPCSASSTATSG